MPQITMSHFEFCVVFALLMSIVLGATTERTDHERVAHAIHCFLYFMVTVFGLAWLMYLGHG